MGKSFAVSGRVWDWKVLDRILRTDQLLLPVIGYPVSMALAALLVIVSVSWIIIWHIRRHKNSIKYIWMGKSSTRGNVWRIWKNTAIVYPFSRKTGKTLDFRVVLGYYGYIVVESGVKSTLWCKW